MIMMMMLMMIMMMNMMLIMMMIMMMIIMMIMMMIIDFCWLTPEAFPPFRIGPDLAPITLMIANFYGSSLWWIMMITFVHFEFDDGHDVHNELDYSLFIIELSSI